MDKCWFVLRQTHYPAPEYKHQSMAFGEAEGPLRLGHIIASPKEVDNVINRSGITPFPRDMRIWPTRAVDFRFSKTSEKDVETSSKAGVPIAAGAGITVNGEAGVVFKRMMGNTWAIDRLDTQVVQPTMAYLEQCRRSAEVAAWVEKKKLLGVWKVYMVTGLMIARGAKNERRSASETGENLGGGVDLPTIATAETNIAFTNKKESEISGEYVDDFVWAYRLTEVSKGFFGSDISQKVVTKGTVFAPGSDKVDIDALMAEEGLDSDHVHSLEIDNGNEQQFLVAMDGYQSSNLALPRDSLLWTA